MATAKKSKKSARKPSAAHRKAEAAQSPEELLKQMHNLEVKDLGERMIALFGETKYHPTVLLDTLQVMLSVGIGSLYGEEHRELYDAHADRFHDESKMLLVLEKLEERFAPEEPEEVMDAVARMTPLEALIKRESGETAVDTPPIEIELGDQDCDD